MPLIYDPQTDEVTEELPERPTRASVSQGKKKPAKKTANRPVRDVVPPGAKQEFGVTRFPSVEETVKERRKARLSTKRQAGRKFRRPRLEDTDPNIHAIRAATPEERMIDTSYEVNRDFGLEGISNIVNTTVQTLGEAAVELPQDITALGLTISDKLRQMRGVEPETADYAEALEAVADPTREAKAAVRRNAPTDLELDKSWAYGKIPRGAASSIPYFGASLLAGPGGAALLGSLQNAGQTYEDAIHSGASPEEALKAALPAGIIGSSEGLLGVGSVGSIARIGRRGVLGAAVREGIEEGLVQEPFTQLANNINAKIISGYDPKRAFTEGLTESILTGGGVGLLFGGGATAASRLVNMPQRSGPREFSIAIDDLPERVYHGTPHQGQIDSFDKNLLRGSSAYGKGVYTSVNPEVASRYASEDGQTGAVYPLRMALANPYDTSAPAESVIEALIAASAKEPKADPARVEAELRALPENANAGDAFDAMVRAVGNRNPVAGRILQMAGYDGVFEVQTGMLVAFDPAAVSTGFSPTLENRADRPESLGFYSSLRDAIVDKLPNHGSAQQLLATLVKPDHGVKAEELEWSGVKEYLEEKAAKGEKVSKQELLDVFESNQIELKEHVYMDEDESPEEQDFRLTITDLEGEIDDLRSLLAERYMSQLAFIQANPHLSTLSWEEQFSKYMDYLTEVTSNDPDGDRIAREIEAKQEHVKELEAKYEQSRTARGLKNLVGPTRFGDWVTFKRWIPGTYREIVITLPNHPDQFRSTHWPQDNPVVHFRVSDTIDINGRRVLQVQEIQSDWHQEGRSKGYRGHEPSNRRVWEKKIRKSEKEWAKTATKADWDNRWEFEKPIYMWDVPTAEAARDQAWQRYDELSAEFRAIPPGSPASVYQAMQAKLIQAREQADLLAARVNQVAAESFKQIADAPFKDTWHELAMKRVIRYAAEHGYDSIVWASGAAHIDVYTETLRQNVDELILKKHPGATPEKPAVYSLIAKKDGRVALTKPIDDFDDLSEKVGHQMATKLWDQVKDVEIPPMPARQLDGLSWIWRPDDTIELFPIVNGILDYDIFPQPISNKDLEFFLGVRTAHRIFDAMDRGEAELLESGSYTGGILERISIPDRTVPDLGAITRDDVIIKPHGDYVRIYDPVSNQLIGEVRDDEDVDGFLADPTTRNVITPRRGIARIAGDDLSIGGQLHKLLYDEKLPQFAKKFGRKFGAKYEFIKGETARTPDTERFYVSFVRDPYRGIVAQGIRAFDEFVQLLVDNPYYRSSSAEDVDKTYNELRQDPTISEDDKRKLEGYWAEVTIYHRQGQEISDTPWRVVDGRTGEVVVKVKTEEEARNLLETDPRFEKTVKTPSIHSLSIPESMRKSVMDRGVPLFDRAVGYYSALVKNIQEKFPAKIKLDDVRKRLTSESSGVKKEEYEVSSIDELLAVKRFEGSDTITKQELLDYLAENHIQVHERTFGGPKIDALKQRLVELYEERNSLTEELIDVELGLIKPYEHWLRDQVDGAVLSDPMRHYIRERDELFWQSPEHTDVLNRIRRLDEETTALTELISQGGPIGAEREVIKGGTPGTMREIVLSLRGVDTPAYTGGHFGHIPNTVAYVRFNEGVDAEGRKVLIGQNFQSDVHQQGRDKGYRNTEYTSLPVGWTVKHTPGKYAEYAVYDAQGQVRFGGVTEHEARRHALAYLNGLMDTTDGGVADLPFKTTWPDLLMKRLVKYAADNGFDRIVWTTGQQQINYWAGHIGEGEGKGHKIIYDEKLPKAAKALAKRYGSVYGTVDGLVAIPPYWTITRNSLTEPQTWYVRGKYGEIGSDNFDTREEAEAEAELLNTNEPTNAQKIHYLDITPAMREQAQGEGFPLFHRPGKSKRRHTDEEDMIRRWDVPRWDPYTNSEPASQMVQFARFEFKPHGNRGRIYTNNIGTIVIKTVDNLVRAGRSISDKGDDQAVFHSHGKAIPLDIAQNMIEWINENAPEAPDTLIPLRNALTQAVATAVRRGQNVVTVISMDRTDTDAIRKTMRHEDIHRWQWGVEPRYGYVVDPAWAREQWWYSRGVASLQKQGYNFPQQYDGTYTVELLAHLGAGQHAQLGYTPEEGAKVVGAIIKHVAETRGLEALRGLVIDVKVNRRIHELSRSGRSDSGRDVSTNKPATGLGRRLRERFNEWVGPRGGSQTALPPDVVEDFENVDTSIDPPGRWERLRTALRGHGLPFEFTWVDKLKRLGIDEAHPILKAWHFIQTGQELPSENAEYLLRLWLGSNGKVDRIFSDGMINGQNRIITPGGLDWLLGVWDGAPKSQIEDEMGAAIHLMVSERTLELATTRWAQPGSTLNPAGPITGVADVVTQQQQGGDEFMADIQASIRKMQQLQQRDPQSLARIQEAANRYRKWARALLDYQLEKGRLSQARYDELVANGDYYVDLHRLFDEELETGAPPNKYGKVKRLIHKYKGSKETISNPYINLMDATARTIKESDRNYAMNAFVEPLRQPQQDPQLQALYHMIGHRLPQPTRDTIKVYNQGTEEYWAFHPEIEAALKGYGDIPSNWVYDLVAFPFKVLRTAITHTPGFLFRNFVRDAQQRTLLSRANRTIRQILHPLEGSKPWDAVTQIFKPLSKDDRDSFWLMGAAQAGYYANSRIDWQSRLRDAVNDVRGDRSVILAFSEQLWDFVSKDVPTGVENINRFAEFKEHRKQGAAHGMSQYDVDIKAAFEARDLMDFAVTGTAVKHLNRFVLFLNPALQGAKRTIKSAKEAPLPFLFRWSLYALAPSIGELIWNVTRGDDELEEWRNLPGWRKDFFFNLKVGDQWLAIPKPFEMGVAASMTNRLIDYAYFGNKNAFEDSGHSIWKSLIPIDDVSKLVGPFSSLVESAANWSFFYDEHIISPYEENRDPELQRKRGSFIGQQIGKLVNSDPRMVDHFMRANFSDWAVMANYVGELFNAELKPEDRVDIYKKLVTLSTGNAVRPFKPDQAVNVKSVMRTAMETTGERAEWYEPLAEYINAFRDTTEPAKRQEAVRNALTYADRVRLFVPQLRQDLRESMARLDKLEKSNPEYKALDKRAQNVIDSKLRSELRSFSHDLMTARVRGDGVKEAAVQLKRELYSLELSLAREILKYQTQTEKKALGRQVSPPMPQR